jgi:hypothetical protein
MKGVVKSIACLTALACSMPAFAEPEREHREPPAVSYRRRPGPRIMLPLKIDLGAAGANTSRGFAPGIAGSIGIHWSSLSPNPTDTDVGVGVFGALLAAPKDDTMPANGVAYGGAYVEGGHTLSRGDWWRTWASGRGEYLASSVFGAHKTGLGGSARLSAEIYFSGIGIEPRGIFLGSYALGVYIDAGVHDVAPGLGKFHVGGGLTFSTPLVFAF